MNHILLKTSACFLTAGLLLATGTVQAQPAKGKQPKGQTSAYLGETSRSALSKGVLDRLEQTSGKAGKFKKPKDRVVFWFNAMLDSSAIDHTPDPDTGEVDFYQGGPTRSSRAFAIVQTAVFDALNAFDGKYQSYNDLGTFNTKDASKDAAITYAAYNTLRALYPDQSERLLALLQSDLGQLKDSEQRIVNGQAIGEAAAAAMLEARRNDNADHLEPAYGEGGAVADGNGTYHTTRVNTGATVPGEWQPDPVDPVGDDSVALGAYWGSLTPFSLTSGDQFRSPIPPTITSEEYTEAYQEVAALGGSPANTITPSASTPQTRFIGNYWGYDGVPLLGIPPRLFNLIALQAALDNTIEHELELARYFALINVGLADSGIAAWDSKYYYNYWRPVTGIRTDDNNPSTLQDEQWLPVGVSVINTTIAIRPTPPFPSYPSGHATFGASTFEIMRSMFGDQPFTFVSEEYNGEGFDPFTPDTPRPLVPVRFKSYTAAQQENGISRIYNGVHWDFDNIAGQVMGVQIAQNLMHNVEAFSQVGKSKDGK
ncbi:vanadium-dependent haloperoxidase [Microbulbifer sp. OS29]|uniref:Vanadium-dependent haloperoxidase n=1 Tax=Microbulbifer okhotskensis TaxID=2926617 RepID=A0A9X2J8T3_9GAMM|nr:vanadium-dependent haloperoxidase [Microbulbifer okhotskensis]MCO1335881.1 vanadium-dependent haloperoxidase [Microbulbifer okhotskensis]